MRSLVIYYILIMGVLLSIHLANAQIITPQEMVTYQKQSNFIKELQVPVKELRLEGIATDIQGSVWFLHSTNKTSIVFKFNPSNGQFDQYPVQGETVSDNAIINLAAGHLVFGSENSAIWFTDARTNSIGKLDTRNGSIQLTTIPTQNAGPMGVALAPDGKSIWFTEIMGDKIAQVDIESMKITEYPLAENSGPALMAFDDNGILWVSLSFSNSVLRVDPQALSSSPSSSIPSSAMTEFKLSGGEEDTFSPFGIAVSGGKVYVSDHGSSRVIVADTGFANYISYWTSPSKEFPTTLPGEIIVDKGGDVYFPQHGGNRISMIDNVTGVMTEYEIPTGPLSTALFIAASNDGKVWFTEWAANKIGYLDTNVKIPFDIQVAARDITLTEDEPKSINISMMASSGSNNSTNSSSPISTSEIEIAVIGMTDSGLQGLTYTSQPQRVNLSQNHQADAKIDLKTEEGAMPGKYTLMVRAISPEKEGSFVSKLYPVSAILDVSPPLPQAGNTNNDDYNVENMISDLIRYASLSAAIALAGYIIYRRIKKRRIMQK
jgi:virginiamycin B lyase